MLLSISIIGFFFTLNFMSILFNPLIFLWVEKYSKLQQSMNLEEGLQGQIQQLGQQWNKIQQCMQKFPVLESKIGSAQLVSMQTKYQYFLRKFQKYTEQHQKYQRMFDGLQQLIQQSNQIREENSSIEFIKKVMEDTERRYQQLKLSLEDLRKGNQQNCSKLQGLKMFLKNVKRKCFQLQRKQAELNKEICVAQKQEITESIQKTMFKIRTQKKTKMFQSQKIKPIQFKQLTQNSGCWVNRKIAEQLQLIDQIKHQFLRQVGKSQKEIQKENERSFSQQNYLNQLIKKRHFKIRDKNLLKCIDNYDPKDHAIQIFQMATRMQKQHDDFMALSGEQILEQIIKKKKIGSVLRLIQQQKKVILETYNDLRQIK